MDAARIKYYGKSYNRALARLVAEVIRQRSEAAPPAKLMEAALGKIFDVQYSYDFSLPRKVKISQAGESQKVDFIRALTELGLISEKSKDTALVRLNRSFEAAKNELREKIDQGDLPEKEFIDLFYGGSVNGIQGALDRVIGYPAVEGFGASSDAANIPDTAIRKFILGTFTEEILRKLLIRKIVKHSDYLVFKINDEGWKKLKQAGIEIRYGGWPVPRSRKEYEAIAVVLEGVDDAGQLRHVHNGIAYSGTCRSYDYNEVHMYNLSLKRPSSREFYKELAGFSEAGKRVAFVLGVLAHEVTHMYIKYSRLSLKHDILIDYDKKVKLERIDTPYVTRYVGWHEDVYKSSDEGTLEEDFCEAVHAYVINPAYLEREFPARYAFIKEHLPFIKAGSAVELVNELKITG